MGKPIIVVNITLSPSAFNVVVVVFFFFFGNGHKLICTFHSHYYYYPIILRKMSMHIIKDTLISNILLPRMHKNFKKRHSLSHFFFFFWMNSLSCLTFFMTQQNSTEWVQMHITIQWLRKKESKLFNFT